MSEADKLTPEEKLLKVIQGKDTAKDSGGKPSAPSAVAPARKPEPVRQSATPSGTVSAGSRETASKENASAQPPPAKPSGVPTAATKPAQVAGAGSEASPRESPRPSAAETAGVAAAASQAQAPDESGAAGAPKAAALIQKPAAYSSRLGLANRCLAAAALVLVALSGYEILAAAMSHPLDVGTALPEAPVTFASAPVGEPIPCASLKEAFARKPVVRLAPEKGLEGGPGRNAEPTTGWQQYAKNNLNMIGVSGEESGHVVEVVVSDAAMKKIFVVRKGDKFKAGQWEFQVKEITRERIVFERAGEEIAVN